MLNEKILLTQEGVDRKREELKKLIDVERPRNIEALKEARAQGDLSENADYDAARDEQAKIEEKINTLQFELDNYEIITDTHSSNIKLGSHFIVKFKGETEEETYNLVGTTEAKPSEGKISAKSPLGMAVLSKKQGDVVKFSSENGIKNEVEIIKVNID